MRSLVDFVVCLVRRVLGRRLRQVLDAIPDSNDDFLCY